MAITLNDITKYINLNTNFPKLDLVEHSDFLQPFSIPPNLMDERHNVTEDGSENDTPTIIYKENEIIEIPSKLNDNLDLNNYYIFGCFNLLDSILMIIDDTYKLKNKTEKQESILNLVNELRLNLDSLYSCNVKYFELYKAKKNKIDQELKKFVYNLYILQLVCELKDINITVINLDKELYSMFKLR